MHKYCTLILALTIFGQPLSAQEIRSALHDDLARTYGFCQGQKRSMVRIQNEFPTLANSAGRAQLAFDQVFRRACENIETELQQLIGQKWSIYKGQIDQRIATSLGSSQLQESQAKSFIDEVGVRAKGQIPSPTLQILLSRRPDFQSNPARELISGFKIIFQSKGHPKAKGLDFRIEYPRSWFAKEGIRPHVLQLITSENGRGLENIAILVKELPLPPDYPITEKDKDELFSVQGMKEMLPAGASLISALPIILDRQKAGMIIFDSSQKRVDMNITTRSVHFVTLYKNKMIFIQGMVASKVSNHATVQERYRRFEPLFKLVANSFVLLSQY